MKRSARVLHLLPHSAAASAAACYYKNGTHNTHSAYFYSIHGCWGFWGELLSKHAGAGRCLLLGLIEPCVEITTPWKAQQRVILHYDD
jgi:hypothetical protein